MKVSDNGDGTLKTEISYDPEDKTITNTYEAAGEAVLEVTKKLEGAEWPEGKKLTFTLSGEGGTLPETVTATLEEAGTAKFGAISYTEADIDKEYTYTISEDGFGDGWESSGNITAKVKVSDNGDGTLKTEISYDPEDMTIINTYKAEGSIVLGAVKILEGGDLTERAFEFELVAPDGSTAASAENDADGNVEFPEITFDQEDAGQTFVYTIREVVDESDQTITYDTSELQVTISVSDNGDGTLEVTSDKKPEELIFTNVLSDVAEVEFSGKKILRGFSGTDKPTFTIQLFEVVDGNEELVESVDVKGSGEFKFSVIEYSAEDVGTHEYIVRELKGDVEGLTYDETEYSITVTVTQNEDGSFSVEISGDNPKKLNFKNEFEKPKVPHLPETGFSGVRAQTLPQQPKDLKYKELRWMIEIPTLSLSTDIVEVPVVDDEYPVTWLGYSAGLLEGSALPGRGRSLITGHNHLNTMEAGPFALLETLSEGDRIFVTDPNDQLQIFEVYKNTKISETDFAGLWKISETDARSLTLITCEDERAEGGYDNRRIIAARPII